MRRWSDLAGRVAATTRTSEKTGLLADYFRTLSADELPIAAVFLTGRAFAETDQRSTGLGWATMAAAIGAVAGVERDALGEAYDRFSDLGPAVEDVLERAGHAPDPAGSPSLVEVATAFAISLPAPNRRPSRASSRSSRATSGLVFARGSWRRPWPKPSSGPSRTSSGRGC
jgi:hypothetical protein